MTQEQAVLQYIKDFGSITSWEAFQDLGVTRIHAIVYRLKKKGYEFVTKPMYSKNRYGHAVRFFRYKLKGSSNG